MNSPEFTQEKKQKKLPRTSETVRDVVIGMSDGLTVPFALAAGLTGVVAASHIVLTAGFAEIAAGSIAMGLGGYLAAQTDAEHYHAQRRQEEQGVRDEPEVEAQEVRDSLTGYGLSPKAAEQMVESLRSNPEAWVDYMMRNELGLEEPDPRRALRSAATIAGSYIVGGLVPLSPYFFYTNAMEALRPSILVTFCALFAFGYIKGRAIGVSPWRSAAQTIVIGGLASTAAFWLAKIIQ